MKIRNCSQYWGFQVKDGVEGAIREDRFCRVTEPRANQILRSTVFVEEYEPNRKHFHCVRKPEKKVLPGVSASPLQLRSPVG